MIMILDTSTLEQKTLQPLDKPVRHEVVTHVLGTTCYLCLRAGQFEKLAEREGLSGE